MKFYIASRYSRRLEMCQVRAWLVNLGHEVTSRWLDTNWEYSPGQSSSNAPPEYREQYSKWDLEDIRKCDCLITFTEPPDLAGGRGGRHVEFGIAIGLNKALVVIGHYENIFHHLPGVSFFATLESFMKDLAWDPQ